MKSLGCEAAWVRTSLGTNQFGYEPVWVRSLLISRKRQLHLGFAPLDIAVSPFIFPRNFLFRFVHIYNNLEIYQLLANLL